MCDVRCQLDYYSGYVCSISARNGGEYLGGARCGKYVGSLHDEFGTLWREGDWCW